MTSESTRELGEAATIVAEWLNSDDPGHTLLIESIASALRAARSSSTGWVPCSERMPELGAWVQGYCPKEDRTTLYLYDEDGWNDTDVVTIRDPQWQPTHWAPLLDPPSDGETGGGR